MVTDPIRRAKWHSSMEERVIVGHGAQGSRAGVGDGRVITCVPSFFDRACGFRVAVTTSPRKGCNFVD